MKPVRIEDLIEQGKMRADLFDLDKVRDFYRRDILNASHLNSDEFIFLLELARCTGYEERTHRDDLSQCMHWRIAEGKVGSLAFFEPSTRTFNSSNKGGKTLGLIFPDSRRSGKGSSQDKGERITHDTMMAACYNAHVVIMRHPAEGSVQMAADYAEIMSLIHDKVRPAFINGGDGSHSHVTQGLLDALMYYTLHFVHWDGSDKVKTGVTRDNVMTGMTLYAIGDSLKGRTIKDNAKLLALRPGNELVLVGPPEILLPEDDQKALIRAGLNVRKLPDLAAAFEECKGKERPQFYFMRLQRERHDPKTVAKVSNAISFNLDMLVEHGLLDKAFIDDQVCLRQITDMFTSIGYDEDTLSIHQLSSPYRESRAYEVDQRDYVHFPVAMCHPLPENKEFPDIPAEVEFLNEFFKPFDEAEMGPYMRAGLIGLVTGAFSRDGAARYVDERGQITIAPYRKLDPKQRIDGDVGIFRALKAAIETGQGGALLSRMGEQIREGMPSEEAFGELLKSINDMPELYEENRHLTFRFIHGEQGTVIDHIENGMSGLIKYQLDLSSLVGPHGCDGKPIVVSAVDNVKSGTNGRKSVIKVRGVLLDPDDVRLRYVRLLSRAQSGKPMTMSHIIDGRVVAQYVHNLPQVLVNFIHCINRDCSTDRKLVEDMPTIFYQRPGTDEYTCRYCDATVRRDQMRPLLIRGG